jgi:hypothetical protein
MVAEDRDVDLVHQGWLIPKFRVSAGKRRMFDGDFNSGTRII